MNMEPNPLDDLDPTLRKAVEQVRSQEPPAGSQERGLERARTLPARQSARAPRYPAYRLLPLALAATLLIGVGVGLALSPLFGPRVDNSNANTPVVLSDKDRAGKDGDKSGKEREGDENRP